MSLAPFEIRPMTPADYHAALALWRDTPWAGNGLVPQDDGPDGIAKFLARNPATCFVAVQPQPGGMPGGESTLAGTVLCGHDGRRGMIYHMCVRQSLQGQGLGRKLVAAALVALRAEGIHKAALVCFRENAGGNAFWQRLGWQRRDDLNYYGYFLDEDEC